MERDENQRKHEHSGLERAPEVAKEQELSRQEQSFVARSIEKCEVTGGPAEKERDHQNDKDHGWYRPQGQQAVDEKTQAARDEMLRSKAEIMREMKGWTREGWREMNEPDRWKLCQATEDRFARLEGREPALIIPLDREIVAIFQSDGLKPPDAATFERYDKPPVVQVNRKLVLETEPDRLEEAYLHEEHHLEQIQAMARPESRPDFAASQIRGWELSRNTEVAMLEDGVDISYQMYRSFAHEVSARAESSRVIGRV